MAADVPKTKDSRFFYFYRTIQPQRPHDPEQVYPSRIAKLRAERIKCFFPLATWNINRLFMPAFQMIGEEINHSPVEVFIHITKTMTLSGQHQQVETLACTDQSIHYTQCIGRMYIVVNISMNQHQMSLQLSGYFRVVAIL